MNKLLKQIFDWTYVVGSMIFIIYALSEVVKNSKDFSTDPMGMLMSVALVVIGISNIKWIVDDVRLHSSKYKV